MADELSYYSVLGVTSDSSTHDIKQAYRRLAMQWHPDRWARSSSHVLSEAKIKFQQIQQAYSVLSDEKKRALYDMELYEEGEDEGYSDFVQEMMSLIAQEMRQKKRYSMEELQTMFTEMVQGFQQSPISYCGSDDYSRDSKKGRWEYDPNAEMNFHFSCGIF
ncbi:uncharacterized protein [Euphorbia lathyris]|uniref:uncharacterized protein n=1 Tax=Euphorbia lathyris TaxID=212925 RepID=UPI00331372A1